MVTAPYDPATLAYHELRAPLGLLLTAAQSAADECEDADIRSRCEVIVRTADRMLRVAQEMLRLGAPAVAGEEVFLPARIAEQVVRDLSALGVEIAFETDARCVNARASGCGATFEALLNSLISNARDHAPGGSIIGVRLANEGSGLLISVSNETNAADGHRGLGAGRYIGACLASDLGAGVFSRNEGGRYVATIVLPVSKAPAP